MNHTHSIKNNPSLLESTTYSTLHDIINYQPLTPSTKLKKKKLKQSISYDDSKDYGGTTETPIHSNTRKLSSSLSEKKDDKRRLSHSGKKKLRMNTLSSSPPAEVNLLDWNTPGVGGTPKARRRRHSLSFGIPPTTEDAEDGDGQDLERNKDDRPKIMFEKSEDDIIISPKKKKQESHYDSDDGMDNMSSINRNDSTQYDSGFTDVFGYLSEPSDIPPPSPTQTTLKKAKSTQTRKKNETNGSAKANQESSSPGGGSTNNSPPSPRNKKRSQSLDMDNRVAVVKTYQC
eukprot:TRINITY_DN1955_c0_g1_i2.p1 TRINITY_DN1955_c0_g1~~TRINITY_DN1955_c0_g1_i2.p1  ORF type:complete len:288 (-),score=79.90 TRINITY_DN1955_c0_g1_i2:49-912(-)